MKKNTDCATVSRMSWISTGRANGIVDGRVRENRTYLLDGISIVVDCYRLCNSRAILVVDTAHTSIKEFVIKVISCWLLFGLSLANLFNSCSISALIANLLRRFFFIPRLPLLCIPFRYDERCLIQIFAFFRTQYESDKCKNVFPFPMNSYRFSLFYPTVTKANTNKHFHFAHLMFPYAKQAAKVFQKNDSSSSLWRKRWIFQRT